MNALTKVENQKEFNWEEYEKDPNVLTPNNNIEGLEKDVVVYSHEPYAQEVYNKLINSSKKFIRKDVNKGEIVQVIDIINLRETEITAELETGITVDVDLSKEKRFINIFGYNNPSEFVTSLKDENSKASFLSHNIFACITQATPSVRISLWEGYIQKQKEEFLKEIESPSKAYIAKIVDANKGGYFVEVQGVRAFMPGSLAAPNKINNFNSLVDTEVTVMIEDYLRDMKSFIVSHKKYLKHIIPIKINKLDLSQRYQGTITGTSKYGIFIEFEEIFTGLLHTSKMKQDTFSEFKKGHYKPGDIIYFYINEITKDNRIILTEENPEERKEKINYFIEKNKNSELRAQIVAKMPFGFIIKIGEISGLIINKDIKNKNKYKNNDHILVKYKEKNNEKMLFKPVE